MPAMKCPKCGSPMTTGFLLDQGQSLASTEWVEGEPRKHWLTGLNLKNRRRIPLNADRCERCGFLELYA